MKPDFSLKEKTHGQAKKISLCPKVRYVDSDSFQLPSNCSNVFELNTKSTDDNDLRLLFIQLIELGEYDQNICFFNNCQVPLKGTMLNHLNSYLPSLSAENTLIVNFCVGYVMIVGLKKINNGRFHGHCPSGKCGLSCKVGYRVSFKSCNVIID